MRTRPRLAQHGLTFCGRGLARETRFALQYNLPNLRAYQTGPFDLSGSCWSRVVGSSGCATVYTMGALSVDDHTKILGPRVKGDRPKITLITLVIKYGVSMKRASCYGALA